MGRGRGGSERGGGYIRGRISGIGRVKHADRGQNATSVKGLENLGISKAIGESMFTCR